MQERRGDDALVAVENLLHANYESGFRLALVMLRDRGEAEDVLQVAAVRAWRALARSTDVRVERAWFLGIVANECRRARHRRWWSVLRVAELERTAPASSNPDDVVDIRKAVAALPYTQREVIALRYYVDLPYSEIAAMTGTSPEVVRARAHRALRRLEPLLRVNEVVS